MNDQPAAPPETQGDDLPEQMQVRLDKRQRLLDSGREAYPIGVERSHTIQQIREQYDALLEAGELEPDTRTGQQVAIVGRVIFQRNTGKLCFAKLREGSGAEIQVMLSLADVGEESLAEFKALVDIGDLLAVRGEVITSRRGELSVSVTEWELAAKTLRPLPNEHRPLSDEARIRLRYVDMMIRPEAREMVRTKATVLRSLRQTLDERGYVEVETPILQLTNGGAAARPFRTHLNALDQPMLLRIALELDLKRAMIGGVDKVYEIGRTFRNEGLDSTHAAEFSMLEAYEAYGDQFTMMDLTKALVVNAARAVGRTVVPGRDGSEIDLEGEWRQASILDLVSEAVGEEVTVETSAENLRKYSETHGVDLQPKWGAEEIVVELYEQLCEDHLINPTFVMDYPAAVKPLAKPHRSKAGLNEAWDLIINGVELAPAYSELNDPVLQRQRLEAQSRLAAQGDPEAM
ncbi:MAG: lysine--tRNA ligase, partial [Marmoricola sp.]